MPPSTNAKAAARVGDSVFLAGLDIDRRLAPILRLFRNLGAVVRPFRGYGRFVGGPFRPNPSGSGHAYLHAESS